MKKFWAFISKYATKLATYAAEHPDQVIAVVSAVKAKKNQG
ncbi:MAG: hypothetical protein AB7J46_06480 [Candidatus Altimarinota bacterium]